MCTRKACRLRRSISRRYSAGFESRLANDGVAKCDIGAFELVPPNPLDLLGELVAQLRSAGLHHGIETALLATLDAAILILGDLQASNDHAAANILDGFIKQVDAQRGRGISAEDADALVEAAQRIIDLVRPPNGMQGVTVGP